MHTPRLKLEDIRQDYRKAELHEESVNFDALEQFTAWLNEAMHAQVPEPTAMSLATVDAEGVLSSRIVLLKQIAKKGLVFFTNYESRKGKAIANHQQVALLFFWPELERQIRIEGKVEKIPIAESEAYFHSRPIASQIGALASHQSQTIKSRNILEDRYDTLLKEYRDQSIPMPTHWGGYLVKPDRIEFWQGRASRLHDRLQYRYQDGLWIIERLQP